MSRTDLVRERFGAWAPSYDRAAESRAYTGDIHVADAVLERIGRRREMLVDLGAGTGRVLSRLSRDFKRAVAVDVSEAMLCRARAKGAKGTALVCDLAAPVWPIRTACADAVTAAGLLEFIPRPEGFFAEAARILRRDGLGVFTYEVLAPTRKTCLAQAASYRFTPRQIEEAASGAGLVILAHERIEGFRLHGQAVPYGVLSVRRRALM